VELETGDGEAQDDAGGDCLPARIILARHLTVPAITLGSSLMLTQKAFDSSQGTHPDSNQQTRGAGVRSN
jgi:hypothetical protein